MTRSPVTAELIEECERVGDERCACRALLVTVGLNEHDSRVVIDRDVQVVVALPATTARLAHLAAVDPPPAAIRNPAEFLHINMDQLARVIAFVADDVARDPVQTRQPGQAVSDENGMHS